MRRLALAAALAMITALGALGAAPVRAQSSEPPHDGTGINRQHSPDAH